MKKLSKEQIRISREKIKGYIENFRAKKDVNGTRAHALTLISTICGDKSNEYIRFRDIGFSSFGNGGEYSDIYIDTFISELEGLLDCLDVFDGK